MSIANPSHLRSHPDRRTVASGIANRIANASQNIARCSDRCRCSDRTLKTPLETAHHGVTYATRAERTT